MANVDSREWRILEKNTVNVNTNRPSLQGWTLNCVQQVAANSQNFFWKKKKDFIWVAQSLTASNPVVFIVTHE